MKNKALLLIFFNFFLKANAQDLPNDLSVSSSDRIAKLVPSSPNAYQITKYGEIPVNESTGEIKLNVPLFQYNVGDLKLNIDLDYSGNGVKTDQYPSIVGMNWALNSGGVITREVRDKVDENALKRYHYNIEELNQMQGAFDIYDTTSEWATTLESLGYDFVDSESDIFHYNFPGHSGSFFLDKNLIPHLIKYDKEIKIEVFLNTDMPDDASFKITDEIGNSYFFGGIQATEISQIQTPSNGALPTSLLHGEWVPTTFFLKKISSWKKDTIYFKYEAYNHIGYFYESMNMQAKQVLVKNNKNNDKTLAISPFPEYNLINTVNHKVFKDNKKIFLKKIFNNRNTNQISFDYQQFNSTEYFLVKTELYDSINGIKKINKLVNFEYENVKNDRQFLKKVIFKDSNQTTDQQYSFEYDNLESLPKRDTYASDHFGYYNGKNSNLSLIPKKIYSDRFVFPEIFNLYQNSFLNILADREADFNYAKIGSLKKVTYPTGGYTFFEYESGSDGFVNRISTVNLHIDYNNETNTTPSVKDEEIIKVGADDIVLINLKSYCYASLVEGVILANLKITDLTTGEITNVQTLVGSIVAVENIPIINEVDKEISLIANHEYKLELFFDTFNEDVDYTQYLIDNTLISADVNIEYPTERELRDALGIRIKRIISQADEKSSPVIKRYYYNKKEEISKDTFSITAPSFLKYDNKSYYVDIVVLNKSKTYTPAPLPVLLNIMELKSDNFNNSFLSDSNKKMYEVVTVSYGGDNFENGGEEFFFKVNSNVAAYNYFTGYGDTYYGIDKAKLQTNVALDNGTLIKKNIFKKEGDSFKNLKKIDYEYITKKEKSFSNPNMAVFKVSDYYKYNITPSSIVRNLTLEYYENISKWQSLDLVKETYYFDNDSIMTYKKYFYDKDWPGLPSKINTKLSTENEENFIYYYPDDIKDINSLPGNELLDTEVTAYDDLKMNHKHVLKPIQIESYIDTLLTKRVRTTYKRFGENDESFLTLKWKEKEGIKELEDRIIYSSYDSFGNPLEIISNENKHQYFIWGYNNEKLIAKIDNFSSDQVKDYQSYINNIITISNKDNDNIIENPEGNEYQFLTILNKLRNSLPYDTQITSYTYDPLIGVTSITQPNGDIQYYKYDNFNRLSQVLDQNKLILKEYNYNYKSYPIDLENINIVLLDFNSQLGVVTFKVDTNNLETDNLNYLWSVSGVATISSGQETESITVNYQCEPDLSFDVTCLVTDINNPDNNLTLYYNFTWDGCISGGEILVDFLYENTSGKESPSKELTTIFLTIDNLSGEMDDLQFKWYYEISNEKYYINSTIDNNIIINKDDYPEIFDIICGKTVSFECEITSNLLRQTYNVDENGVTHYIICSDE